MKIDFKAPFQVPQNRKADYHKDAAVCSSASTKVDVVDFTRGQTSVDDRQLVNLKASLQSSIAFPNNPGRLDALREKIQQGSYFISTDALVDAILHLDE